MYSCIPNLSFGFLTICEIITFKVEEKVILLVAKGMEVFLEPKKNQFQYMCVSEKRITWGFQFKNVLEAKRS